jgi:hypothetical protein
MTRLLALPSIRGAGLEVKLANLRIAERELMALEQACSEPKENPKHIEKRPTPL